MENPQPLGGDEMTRAGGPGTFMRLPTDSAGPIDVAVLGIPLDAGASNRPGSRFGPRAIRAESAMLRPVSLETGASPFRHLAIADVGDVPVIPYNLARSLDLVSERVGELVRSGSVPLLLGGDHTLSLGALRGMRDGGAPPPALVHFDAHADTNLSMSGELLAHGTPFRRAVEEGLIDEARTVRIGLRGTGYRKDDWEWGTSRGFTTVTAAEVETSGVEATIRQARAAVGQGPAYLSFDIDTVDPSAAPGTGSPEPGGLSPRQAISLLRGLKGIELAGADVVEVSPPYDPAGITALLAATVAFEILCLLPGSD